MPRQNYPGIDARLVSIVRIKCNRLIGRYGIRAEDLEDFYQEWIAAAIRTPEYQNRQHPQFTTFIGRVIDRLILEEIRIRKTTKRQYVAIAYSLDDYIGSSDSEETWHDVISEQSFIESTGRKYTDPRDASALRQDLDAFMSILPAELQELAEHLKYHPITDIAALIGVSRITAFRRLRNLRQAAAQFFLKNPDTVLREISQRPETGPSGD